MFGNGPLRSNNPSTKLCVHPGDDIEKLQEGWRDHMTAVASACHNYFLNFWPGDILLCAETS